MNPTDSIERIESLKAGTLAAIAAAIPFVFIHLMQEVITADSPVLVSLITWVSLIQTAIVLISGFLFGVTYRYAVRQDANPQLKAGTVMAFGLVRGMAQIDVESITQAFLLSQAASVLNSLVLFAIACLVLELAMHQGWVKPFRS
jgi:hypothetical protein